MGNIPEHRGGKMLMDLVVDGDYWYIVMRIKRSGTNGFVTKSGPRHQEPISFWAVIKDMGHLYRAIAGSR